jgi:hypothetical protein
MARSTFAEPQNQDTRDQCPSDEALGDPVEVPKGGWRDRIRSKPGIREAYRVGVFVLGVVFIVGGIALAVLPGPLTIPPVLIGLWIWSTEFRFAESFFETFRDKGREAWAHAKRHPASSSAITAGGLIAAAAAFWAIRHYALIDHAKSAIL